MASKAKKLPSGSWRARASYKGLDGKYHSQSFTASTKKEAEYMAAEYEQSNKEVQPAKMWTLKEAVEKYVVMKSAVLSPTTIAGYNKILKYSFQGLMPVPIGKLTESMIASAIAEELKRKPLKGTNPTVSPKTIKNEYGLISSVLSWYMPEKSFRVDLPRVPRRIRTLPEPADIIAAVKGTSVELPCLLAMWLSLSESEIRGLTKSKSIDGDYLTIREVLVYGEGVYVRKDLAKTDTRTRRHKIPPYIKGLIDQVPGDVIVPMLPCNIYRNFQKCLERNNIPLISFHDLRHISASVMAVLQVPDKYAQERGGWSSDYVMKKVYTEVFSAERQRVDAVVDGYFEKIVNNAD